MFLGRFLALVFVLFFSFSVSAQESAGSGLNPNLEIDCANHIKNLNFLDSGELKEGTSLISGILINCSNEFVVANTPNKILYFIFGDIYVEALYIATIPVKLFSDYYFSKMYAIGTPPSMPALGSDLEDMKENFGSKMFFGDVFSNTIQAIVFLINSIAVIIIAYAFGKKVLKYQAGEFDRNDTKELLKVFAGIGLIAPFGVIYGYSLIQFLFLIVVAFGVIFANIFFAIIFIVLIGAQSQTIEYGFTNNNEALHAKNLTVMANTFDGLIRSDLCLIKELEQVVDKNISDPNIVKENLSKSFDLEPNFFNCLNSAVKADKSGIKTTARVLRYNKCVSSYNYYYDGDGDKKTIFVSPASCGQYLNKESPDKKYQDVFDNAINPALDVFEQYSFDVAKKYYYQECKQRFSSTIGNSFECAKFDDFGDFIINDGKIENVDIVEGLSPIDLTIETEFINREAYTTLKVAANNVYREIMSDDVKEYVENNQIIEEFKDSYLAPAIKNGFVGAAAIFLPKGLLSIADDAATSIENNSEYSAVRFVEGGGYSGTAMDGNIITEEYTKIEAVVNMMNFSIDTPRTPFYNSFQEIFKAEGLDKDYGFMSSTKTGFVEKFVGAMSYNGCMIQRNCDYTFFAASLNPLEVYSYFGQEALTKFSTLVFAGYALVIQFADDDGPRENAKIIHNVGLIGTALSLFAIFLLPMIPFFIFFSAILGWIYKLFLAPVLIQIYAVYYLVPDDDNEDFANEKTDGKIYKIFIEMALLPIFIVIALVITFFINFLSLIILNYSLGLAMNSFMVNYDGLIVNYVMSLIFFVIYMFLSFFVVFKVSSAMFSVIKYLVQYLGLDGFDDKNYFDNAIDAIKRRLMLAN